MVNSQFSEDDTVGSSVYCISPIHFNEVLCYVSMNSILVPYITMTGVSWLVLCYLREKHRSIPSTNWGFPGGSVVKNLPARAGDTVLIPGLGGPHMLQSG